MEKSMGVRDGSEYQIGWIFGKVSKEGGGSIFNPKVHVVDFGPLGADFGPLRVDLGRQGVFYPLGVDFSLGGRISDYFVSLLDLWKLIVGFWKSIFDLCESVLGPWKSILGP